MRYAPEDEPNEPEIYYCAECGCSLSELETNEALNGDTLCKSCYDEWNAESQ